MALISPPTAPPDLSTDTLIARAQGQALRDINMLFSQMLNVYRKDFDAVWNSPDYTGAQFLAQQGPVGGTNAAELFRLTQLLATTIQTAHAVLTTPYLSAPKAVTINGDGTVTVAD